MINIVSWNIQCGRGVDGIIDFQRIASVIKQFGDVDVICLQEVSRYDPELDDSDSKDQKQVLADLFPDYQVFFGPALNRRRAGDEHRRMFGNMILSRLPVLQQFNHLLPQPAPPEPCKNMARQALEVVIEGPHKCFRLTTTHLEFFSAYQRLAQVNRLLEIQNECAGYSRAANQDVKSGPYAKVARPAASIICGDFNSLPGDDAYNAMISAINSVNDRVDGYVDAWASVFPGQPHIDTCGVFDIKQWPDGAHCRDYFFLTQDLKSSIQTMAVNTDTAASDHQPVLLTLNC